MSVYKKSEVSFCGDWTFRFVAESLPTPITLKGSYETSTIFERHYYELSDRKSSSFLAEFTTLPGFQKNSLSKLFSLCQQDILSETTPDYWQTSTEDEFDKKKEDLLKKLQKENGLPEDDLMAFSSCLEQLFCASHDTFQTRVPGSEVLTNQLITDPENLIDRQFNSSVLKIKISKENLSQVRNSLQKRLQKSPDMRFRLDGNQRLSPSDILEFHKNCSAELKKAIDYYEEPCQDIEEHLNIAEKLPLGLDETLRTYQQKILIRGEKNAPLLELIDRANCFICKPFLHGGPLSAKNLFNQLNKQNQKSRFIISHCFEGPIGLKWNKNLARFIDEQRGIQEYHGLGSSR